MLPVFVDRHRQVVESQLRRKRIQTNSFLVVSILNALDVIAGLNPMALRSVGTPFVSTSVFVLGACTAPSLEF